MRVLVRTCLLLSVFLVHEARPAAAQASEDTGPCSGPEYRQFDFWIGDWVVRNPAGEIAGHNTVTSILGGCAVREQWRGAAGSNGESVNAYDRATGTWHQSWASDRGFVLRLEGRVRDGAMVLEGQLVDGASFQLQRVTWTPDGDGGVRQVWEQSEDGGETWRTVFDGTYRRLEGG